MLALLALAISTPAHADTLVDNVNGITLDKDGKLVRFTGLVIGSDGKVKQLLDRKDKRPERPDFKEDGRGRTLIPGLIDAHGHVMGLGFQLMLLDLSGTNSLAEAQAAIRKYAAENPEMPWIIGFGWNQEKWGLGRFPTAADLDAAVPDRAVWLERVDGHAGWANTAAMTAAKITAATKAPEGGRIEMAGGRPSGVFVDAAMGLIDGAKPKPLARDLDRAFLLAQQKLISQGITSIADMGTTIAEWQAYRRAGDKKQLAVRILSYGGDIDNMAIIAGSEPTPWLYDDKLRMVGVKLYLDGALGSRGAWLKAPYSDAPGQKGLPLLSPAQLRNKMVRASMDKFQVAIHAIGDAANAEALSAIADLTADLPGERRWRIEHAQIVDPLDIPKFAELKVIASMQPVHQTSDRLMAEARLGPDRLKGAYAWRSMEKAGVRLAFGSDVPVESANPFPGIAAAISRTDAAGQPVGGWRPEETVTRETALDGFTRTAAYAAFAEDRLGTLMPGMRADFVMLESDPLLASPDEIRKMTPLETWIGGYRYYKKSEGATVGR
ncbi:MULTISPECIES: amidohydrolase [unclassified Sphingopyxis]|uniref:amidohydrolase n=1 Tax=unclassified Sphingopyxis TaxID=2614943 RepID=UPI00073192C0|nr:MULTISPECIES: amidohydrolase [unclassified Sphingopyxis]KTE23010.1 metal-dependent hydrolase [Sphingopyxis sp. H057]KTE49709.1 metal-dependent hydrolase [Sphingopyxis sp. H073]KTE54147.1 metal-dependent hydrolase [Sphingopyxis sp. H071]KTE58067.1 metal-dependent hydrolase [Sphingopyxis sp. H107]KTE60411.1 metal-dependent hydrolase [Sphingopyxis sp. H100]